MASFEHIQFGFIVFLLCVSRSSMLAAHRPANSDLVHRQCHRSHQLIDRLKPDRCIALLSTDPRATKATNLKTLALIGLELAMKNATQVIAHINATLSSNQTSHELISCLKAMLNELINVKYSFLSAYSEVKDGEYMIANYDCFVLGDYIQNACAELQKVKGKIDFKFYERSLGYLSEFGLINYALTYYIT